MIIAIDGNHGVGKSTIINHLKKHYSTNTDVIFLKYPTFSDIANLARNKVGIENNDVLSLLFSADLTSCYQNYIHKNLNKIYVMDRYVLSLFAFQGKSNKDNYQFLYNITNKIQYPDIQIVIHNDDDIDLKNNIFIAAIKHLLEDNMLSTVHIVKNTFGTTDAPNLTGLNEVKKIIDNAIASNYVL